MTREEYREVYLRSQHWLEVRRRALDRAERRCQVCNGEHHLDVHHRTYERIGFERPADLTVLCRRCHDLFHAAKPAKKHKPKKRRKGKPAPGMLSWESVHHIEQAVPDPNVLWLVARDQLSAAPWSTAGDVAIASQIPPGRAYADWAYRVLAAAHHDGLVIRREVPKGKRYTVQWALA